MMLLKSLATEVSQSKPTLVSKQRQHKHWFMPTAHQHSVNTFMQKVAFGRTSWPIDNPTFSQHSKYTIYKPNNSCNNYIKKSFIIDRQLHIAQQLHTLIHAMTIITHQIFHH